MPGRKTRGLGSIVGLLLLWSGAAQAEYGLNMTRGVTPLSAEIYDLHMLIFWICCAIAAVVFGVMIWSFIFHRKSRGAVAAKFHHNTTAEFVWTIIPILILIGMAIPATKTLVKIEQTADADMQLDERGRPIEESNVDDFGPGVLIVDPTDPEELLRPDNDEA